MRLAINLRKLIGSSLALSILAAAPSWAEVGVTAQSITLGQSAAFTGPAAELGIQFHAGAKLYFDSINKQGGVHGRKVEILTADDKYEPELAAENTKRFTQKLNVFALFGYVGTPTSNAALPIFTAAKVPFFAPFTGAQSLREPFNRQIFNIRGSYLDEAEHMVDYLVKLGMHDIAIFYQNDSYGQNGLEGVQRALKKRNLNLVASATIERNSTAVADAAAKLLPKRPEVVIQISTYASSAALIKQMKKSGYTGQFYNVSFVGSQALSNVLGDDKQGVGISQVVPFPWRQGVPIVAEYNKALKSAGKSEPNYSGLEGFIAAKVFAEGLRRTGADLTREKFVKALESINAGNYDIGFPINFSPSNHNASNFVDMTIITKNGKFMN